MEDRAVVIYYSLWVSFGLFIFLPLYFSGSRILLSAFLLLFFVFLSIVYQLKKYKNNMPALKIGKSHYFRLIYIIPLLITPAFDNILEYHKEQIMYRAMVKMRKINVKKEEKEAIANKIESLDIVAKVVALPSRLISSAVAWSLSPITDNLDEDSYCSRLLVQKLQKDAEAEILAKIKRSQLSVEANSVVEAGGIDKFMNSISTDALNKLINNSYPEGMGKDLGQALNLVLAGGTCKNLLLR